MRAFHKKKDLKEKVPLKETEMPNNKMVSKDRNMEQSDVFLKNGKEFRLLLI